MLVSMVIYLFGPNSKILDPMVERVRISLLIACSLAPLPFFTFYPVYI